MLYVVKVNKLLKFQFCCRKDWVNTEIYRHRGEHLNYSILNFRVLSKRLPVSDITAVLHPLVNPGSNARIVWPFKGAESRRFLTFSANTSMDDFSAFFVNLDLKKRGCAIVIWYSKISTNYTKYWITHYTCNSQ